MPLPSGFVHLLSPLGWMQFVQRCLKGPSNSHCIENAYHSPALAGWPTVLLMEQTTEATDHRSYGSHLTNGYRVLNQSWSHFRFFNCPTSQRESCGDKLKPIVQESRRELIQHCLCSRLVGRIKCKMLETLPENTMIR